VTDKAVEQPSDMERAAAEYERQRREGAMSQQALLAGAGGGYRPEMVKLVPELEQAYREGMGGIERVQGELAKFQQNPERAKLMAEESARLKQNAVDEQTRLTRLQGLGAKQQQISDEMAGKVEGFRVDPNRLFGQGAQRAAGTFALGLQNILSNVGEAMQGKQATNAVLSLVRDRVAQDISLQESDYQRMLQGYNVKRNGLMDAIQQVGNERQGAEALAKQQGLAYADQLARMAQGVTDAQTANTLVQARSEILRGLGMAKQGLEAQNVQARNAAAAQSAAASERQRMAMAQAANAGIGEKDRGEIGKVLQKAEEYGLMTRTKDLSEIRKVLAKYPNAAQDASGVLGQLKRALAQDSDPGTIARLVSNAATENMSEGGQEFMRAWQRYVGGRLHALGGKAITAPERALFDMANYTAPSKFSKLVNEEYGVVRNEAKSLIASAPFETGSQAYNFLNFKMMPFVSEYKEEPKEAPEFVNAAGKPIK
jgi:hypothetical protein